jgi:hypothetical protein
VVVVVVLFGLERIAEMRWLAVDVGDGDGVRCDGNMDWQLGLL